MRYAKLVNVAAVLLAVCSLPIAASAQTDRARRGAFLLRRADSVSALVTQLSNNPPVAARYAKHFGATPQAVMEYFGANLDLVSLKTARWTTVYYVSKGGRITSGTRFLPAGSKVFVTHSGRLVLQWRCGNPLTKHLPRERAAAPPKVTAPPPAVAAGAGPAVAEHPMTLVASAVPVEVGEIPPAVSVLPSVDALPMPSTVPVVAFETVATPVVSVPPAAVVSTGGFPWLLPVLLGAGVAISPSGDEGPAPAVPEPTSLAALSLGAGALLARWGARKRM